MGYYAMDQMNYREITTIKESKKSKVVLAIMEEQEENKPEEELFLNFTDEE